MSTKLYTYIDSDDNTSLDNLPFKDKILAILFQWFKTSGKEEIQNDRLKSILTNDQLILQADLISFIDKALIPIKQGKRKKVILEIDSIFKNVLKNVLDSKKYKDFYLVEILKTPKIEYNINFSIIVSMKAR